MKKQSLETHYPIHQEQVFVAGLDQMPEPGTFSDSPPYLVTPRRLSKSEIESLRLKAKANHLRGVEILAKQAKIKAT